MRLVCSFGYNFNTLESPFFERKFILQLLSLKDYNFDENCMYIV